MIMKNREIKFRVWSLICDAKMIYLTNGKIDPDLVSTPKWFVMQYTGLKDRNGVEIYEGDIVKETPDHCEEIYIIEFSLSRNSASYVGENIKNKSLHTSIELFELGALEVIGNIYENPELLTS